MNARSPGRSTVSAVPGSRRRILLVEDHPMTRIGVTQRFAIEPDLVVCGEVGTAREALAAVAKLKPDAVIADISMRDTSGLDMIKQLHALHPELPILAFSMHDESLYAERVLRAGGRGYVMKSEGAEKLIEAIRHVLANEIYLSPAMRSRVLHQVTRGPDRHRLHVERLSDRELEVFELIGAGLETSEIARQLHLSVSTIETHRAHIKEKLNLARSSMMVRAAVEWVTTRNTGAAAPPGNPAG